MNQELRKMTKIKKKYDNSQIKQYAKFKRQ